MPLYLTISEGDSADQARPLLATGDRRIIEIVARQIAERCGAYPTPRSKTTALSSLKSRLEEKSDG
jgi:hypothetical protein